MTEPTLRPWQVESFERSDRGTYDAVFSDGSERVRATVEVSWYGEKGLAYLNRATVWNVRASLLTTLELERWTRRNEVVLFDLALEMEAAA